MDIKGNTYILHLLFNCIVPKGGASGFIDGISILIRFWEFKPILMDTIVVSSTLALNQGDNPVSLLEDPAHPPVKSWFIRYLGDKCELSHLEWVVLFEVRQLLPRSTAVLLFTAQL